jgi:hypothetical protein
MTRMNAKLSAIVLAAAVLTTAACGTVAPSTSPLPPSSAAVKPSTKPAAPQPSYADPTRDDTTSVAKLYAYDAAAHSAVVEPIIFLDGPSFCKAFKIKSTDPRCDREWTTEESHTKITVPVSRQPKLTTWDDQKGGDCIGTMTSGGTCPTSVSAFAKWVKDNPNGFVVITTKSGTITKIAEMYLP